MALSGGLAGLAGMAEVTGVVHRLQENFSPGYGFTAIIVAWLAKLNPIAIEAIHAIEDPLLRSVQPIRCEVLREHAVGNIE